MAGLNPSRFASEPLDSVPSRAVLGVLSGNGLPPDVCLLTRRLGGGAGRYRHGVYTHCTPMCFS